jgi:hypothetical protein
VADDEYARPSIYGDGIGTGPREVARYTSQSKVSDQPPVIPPHVELLKAGNPTT